MALPAGLDTVTVTIDAPLYPNGQARKGQIRFTPAPAALVSADENAILAGPVTVAFDGSGVARSAELLATDAAGVLPSGWTYLVEERWADAPSRSYSIALPAANAAVNFADLVPTSPAAGEAPGIGAFGQELVASPDAPAARTALGLGSAALVDVSAFDAAGSAAAAQAAAEAASLAYSLTPSGADDGPALQALLNAGGVVRLRPSATYKLTTGITIDPTRATLSGPLTILDASANTAGPAITITGSVNPPYRQVRDVLQGVELIGPGKTATGTIGIKFDTNPAVGSSSHLMCRTVNVRGFEIGVQFNSSAYCITFDGSDVYNCAVGIDLPNVTSDAGERIQWNNGTVYNNDLGFRNHKNVGEIMFIGTSVDYNAQHADINDSRVYLIGCHVEKNTADTARPFKLAGNSATLVMLGGWMVHSPNGVSACDYIFENNAGAGGGVYLTNVYFNNLRGTSGRLATGSGATVIRGSSCPPTSLNSRIVADAENMFSDGGFEQASIVDDLWIHSDTAAITSRTTGANIILTVSNTTAQSGTQSLRAQKSFGAGSASGFTMAAPIERRSKAGFEFYYAKPGAGTGNVFFTFSYAQVRNGTLPSVTRRQQIGSVTVPFTAAAVPFTLTGTGEPVLRAPAWATHVVCEVNMSSFVGPDSIYFDGLAATTT